VLRLNVKIVGRIRKRSISDSVKNLLGTRHKKIKVEDTLDIAQRHHRSTYVWNALSRDRTVLPAAHAFIHEWHESYLPLPSQPKLIFIYRPSEAQTVRPMYVNVMPVCDIIIVSTRTFPSRHQSEAPYGRSR